tara:strand:+ start:3961 stop:4131 length:171 start_codon:yes stop_codon:yes gene_type:complete
MKEVKVIFVNILKDGSCSAKVGVFIDGKEEPEKIQNLNFSYEGGNVFDEALSHSSI